ncbi:DUF2800 domain-containing protein [Limosilactobacillus fermentum]|uniref:DUF2800 domain-containing protein n=1 Tax=Limosilactobacillus fermentum TaxID=1613 RepID=UPI0021A308B0|nr:DUF2800 domain-containing protein [Limosilactobacillus fermentum]MCT2917059.1 DUF2800 domain-containing protein [Limosilactobacillus fermentum]
MASPKVHATLSASSAHRWLNAPPLPQLEKLFPNPARPMAEEGTAAHALGEYKLRKALGQDSKRPVSDFQSDDMEAFTDDYCDYVMEQYQQAKLDHPGSSVLIEQRLDFSNYVPDGFGTGDCIIIADGLMHIVDFKYGKGVRVDAENNPQMKLYALGALNNYSMLYDQPEVIDMTIFQPRIGNISTWSIETDTLLDWAKTDLKQKAELAIKGNGVVKYGPWLQFSNCNAVLRVRYNQYKKLQEFQLRSPHLMSNAEIEEVLANVDELVKWANQVKSYAQDLAINHGKQWNGFKVVEGRSIRKYKDEATVAKISEENGFNDIYQQSLLPITKLEKVMGKKQFNDLLGQYIYKPVGKLTLVPQSDKRPAVDTTNPKAEFTEV